MRYELVELSGPSLVVCVKHPIRGWPLGEALIFGLAPSPLDSLHPVRVSVSPTNVAMTLLAGPLRFLARTGAQHVVHLPDAFILLDADVPQQAGAQQHFMGGLQNALQMGRITLGEWELLSQPLQRNAP